jgi:Caspase domain
MPEQTIIDPINFTTGFAFIVGVGGDDYMRATANDANKLAAILKDQKIAGYGKDHVYCLTNQEANKVNIERKLNEFVGLVKDRLDWKNATVIIYLSGHGVQIDTGRFDANTETIFEYYFVPYYPPNTDLRDFAKNTDNLISFTKIQQILAPLESVHKQFTILDCCHSGGANQMGAGAELTVTPSEEVRQRLSNATVSAVITSCKGEQKSFVKPDGQTTIFGECLFEALYGKGQSGVRDMVRFLALSSYLTEQVPERTKKYYGNVVAGREIPEVTFDLGGVGNVELCRFNSTFRLAKTIEPVVPSVMGKPVLFAMGINRESNQNIEKIKSNQVTFADKTINKISSFLTVVLALGVIAFGSYFILNCPGSTLIVGDTEATPVPTTVVNGTITNGSPKPTEPSVVFENLNKSKPCGTVKDVGSLLKNQPFGTLKLIDGDREERFVVDSPPTIYLFQSPFESTNLIEVSCISEIEKFQFKNVPENPGAVQILIGFPPQYIPTIEEVSEIKESGNLGVIEIRKITKIRANNSWVLKLSKFAKATNDWETANYCFRYLLKLSKSPSAVESQWLDYFREGIGAISTESRNSLYDDIIRRLFLSTRPTAINGSTLLTEYGKIIEAESIPLKIRKDAVKAFVSATANDEYNKTKDEIKKTLNDKLANATEQEKTFLEDALKQLKKKEEEK